MSKNMKGKRFHPIFLHLHCVTAKWSWARDRHLPRSLCVTMRAVLKLVPSARTINRTRTKDVQVNPLCCSSTNGRILICGYISQCYNTRGSVLRPGATRHSGQPRTRRKALFTQLFNELMMPRSLQVFHLPGWIIRRDKDNEKSTGTPRRHRRHEGLIPRFLFYCDNKGICRVSELLLCEDPEPKRHRKLGLWIQHVSFSLFWQTFIAEESSIRGVDSHN